MTDPTTRAADEDFLRFVAQALKVFGPSCTLRLQIGSTVGRLKFPPDPTWSAKSVRSITTARRKST